MTFDEVLTVLLGWVGRRLSVAIMPAGDAPIVRANMASVLRTGSELDTHGEEAAVYFHLEDARTGFILARQHSRALAGTSRTRRCSSSGSAPSRSGSSGRRLRGVERRPRRT
jgi:hypothetical protein